MAHVGNQNHLRPACGCPCLRLVFDRRQHQWLRTAVAAGGRGLSGCRARRAWHRHLRRHARCRAAQQSMQHAVFRRCCERRWPLWSQRLAARIAPRAAQYCSSWNLRPQRRRCVLSKHSQCVLLDQQNYQRVGSRIHGKFHRRRRELFQQDAEPLARTVSEGRITILHFKIRTLAGLIVLAISAMSTAHAASVCPANHGISATPSRDFVDHGDGTVTHMPTGLM